MESQILGKLDEIKELLEKQLRVIETWMSQDEKYHNKTLEKL